MAKYKVKALTVGGLNKKIYKSGDIVDGDSFSDVELLVEQGFLIPIEEKKAEPKGEKVEEKKKLEEKPQPKPTLSGRKTRK